MKKVRLQPKFSSPVYVDLRRDLESGVFAGGDRLPTLRALAAKFGVPLRVAHQAILRLEHEGFVAVRQGSGTYATDVKPKAHTRTVLLLNPTTGDEWADLTREFMDRFSTQRQTRLLIESTPGDDGSGGGRMAEFREKLREILDGGVDLVLFNGQKETGVHAVLDMIAEAAPLICFYSKETVADRTCGFVVSDWRHGGYIGVRHLIEVGCRDILLLLPPGPEGNARINAMNFMKGAELAAGDAIHKIRVRHLHSGFQDATLEDRFTQVMRGADGTPRPDGVFSSADFRVARLMPVIQRLGLRIPEDVAVLGYFDTPWTMMTQPRLSSISTCCGEIAENAARMCLNNEVHDQVVISPPLVVRGSTRRQGGP